MEIHATDALGRPARAAERTGSPVKRAKAEGNTVRADKLSLSRQAVAYLEERARQAEQEAVKQETETDGDRMLDALDQSLKDMERCQEIARRIMAGDRVPPEDERYLMNTDTQGYKLAMACRTEKKDPKEWESVLEDEEERGADAAEASPAGAEAPAEACAHPYP